MRILITGATGLVGLALMKRLVAEGHDIVALARAAATSGRATWDPSSGRFDSTLLEGVDAVVHLAGENIADGRWTAAKRQRIQESRVAGTRLLASTLATQTNRQCVLVSASAIGWYGHRPGEALTEMSLGGTGFLADVCSAWEAATQPAAEASIRTVLMRFGVILSREGGALAKMLPPFRMAAGGVIGSGRQVWSWIGIEDAVGAILHAITHDTLSGPVNVVAPEPVTNKAFTKTLGRVVGRPTIIPMPAAMARLIMGPMADELLLADQEVLPQRLLASGFEYRHPDLESALRHALQVDR